MSGCEGTIGKRNILKCPIICAYGVAFVDEVLLFKLSPELLEDGVVVELFGSHGGVDGCRRWRNVKRGGWS